MFMWIIETLQGIISTHAELFAMVSVLPFCVGTVEEDLSVAETKITGLEGELATAKEVGSKGFYGSLSEGLKVDPSMLKFEKVSNEEIAKSYISLQSKISAKGLTIPNKEAGEQEISDFYKALGRPNTSDEYQIEVPKDLHESIVSTPESQKVFKDQCHKIGLTPTQTQGLHSWYMTELSNVLKQQDEADTKSMNEAKTALNAKWGTTTEAKTALAMKVIDKFGGDKVQELLDKGFGNNPIEIEMFSEIGEKLSEDVLGPGGKSLFGGLTPAAAQAKVNTILNDPKHPYNIGENPLHKEAVEEMLTLNKIITSVSGGGT